MSADTHQTVIQKRIEQEHIGMLVKFSTIEPG
jgi:hypothetical protein